MFGNLWVLLFEMAFQLKIYDHHGEYLKLRTRRVKNLTHDHHLLWEKLRMCVNSVLSSREHSGRLLGLLPAPGQKEQQRERCSLDTSENTQSLVADIKGTKTSP